MGAVDLDPTNHGSDDVALAHPIEVTEPSVHLGREVLQPADDHGQLVFTLGGLGGGLPPLLEPGKASLQAGDARLELGVVDQGLGIAVDQAADPALQAGDLLVELGDIVWLARAGLGFRQAPAVFGGDAAGLFQNGPHPLPNSLFAMVAALFIQIVALQTGGGWGGGSGG